MAERPVRSGPVGSRPADPGPRPRFAAEAFRKSYGSRVVLKAASCRAVPGRVTVLLGRNGSGKSTLLRAALGLVRADYGVVHWRGRATLRPRLARFAHEGLFFLPDEDLLPRRRPVADHLKALRAAFPGTISLEEWDPLDVAPFLHRRARELSGGERRRVEVTLALLRDPACLIADEPLTGLAPRDQDRFASALRRLVARGAAVLVTGHEVEPLLAIADEVIWLVAGGTYVLGTPEEARVHPQFAREYLGPRALWPARPEPR